MRVVLCEDDLESSQGKRKGGGGAEKEIERESYRNTAVEEREKERARCPGIE